MNSCSKLFPLVVTMLVLWSPPRLEAQTVSVFNLGSDQTARTVEGYLKRNLREEGYTVKGGTVDGFLVLLNTVPIYQDNSLIGFGGTVVIGSLDWVHVSNALLPRGCPAELVSRMKQLLGIDFILIDSKMHIAANESDLALELSTVVNSSVRKGSQKIESLLREAQRSSK